MKTPKLKYKLRYDTDGNVLFLDYGEGEYINYGYRMVWTRRNHHSQVSDWFLVIHECHPNGLALLPKEVKLAKRAYEEITQLKQQNRLKVETAL